MNIFCEQLGLSHSSSPAQWGMSLPQWFYLLLPTSSSKYVLWSDQFFSCTNILQLVMCDRLLHQSWLAKIAHKKRKTSSGSSTKVSPGGLKANRTLTRDWSTISLGRKDTKGSEDLSVVS